MPVRHIEAYLLMAYGRARISTSRFPVPAALSFYVSTSQQSPISIHSHSQHKGLRYRGGLYVHWYVSCLSNIDMPFNGKKQKWALCASVLGQQVNRFLRKDSSSH